MGWIWFEASCFPDPSRKASFEAEAGLKFEGQKSQMLIFHYVFKGRRSQMLILHCVLEGRRHQILSLHGVSQENDQSGDIWGDLARRSQNS